MFRAHNVEGRHGRASKVPAELGEGVDRSRAKQRGPPVDLSPFGVADEAWKRRIDANDVHGNAALCVTSVPGVGRSRLGPEMASC